MEIKALKMSEAQATQQSTTAPQHYLSEKRIFIFFGMLALIICIPGIIYLFFNLSLTGVLEQAALPLTLFLIAGFLGLVDLLLWSQAPDIFSPPASLSFNPQSQVGETQLDNVTTPHPQDWCREPSAGDAPGLHLPDDNATVPVRNTTSQQTESWPSTLNAATPIDESTTELLESVAMPITPPVAPAAYPSRVKTSPLTQKFRYYRVPREGNNVERCADKLAFNYLNGRYALADGVGTSFLPGRWAQVVTNLFVERVDNFEGQDDAVQWLRMCSKEWHKWVEQEWVPQAAAASGQVDWSREIARGAATTFVGCSFSRSELVGSGSTVIHVDVVGDAEFFLLSPPTGVAGSWTCKEYYKLKLEEFGHTTETLATPERRVERDYKWMHHHKFQADRRDCLVLATDALAQWILQQMYDRKDPWIELLSILEFEDFRQFVRASRAKGEIEVDDTTIMIIPLNS